MTDFINPNEETRVSEGSKVELHFSVCIENGVEIDNTRSREEPVSRVMAAYFLVLKKPCSVYVLATVVR